MSALLALVLPSVDGQVAFPVTAGGIKVMAHTQYGNVTGRYSRVDMVNRFYGIPVAATTAGVNRFKKPQPPTPWDVMETIQTGSCFYLSQDDLDKSKIDFIGSEDCLKIDVIAPPAPDMFAGYPTSAPAGTFPCQVWFHGGGFELEETSFWQGNDAEYAGNTAFTHLPYNGKVVTAFPKYRLSVLGAMSHPALRLETDHPYSGSWQMYDALNALRWIQNNIGFFGGDNTKVTIMGQSAGATLSGLLTASPLTYGATDTTKEYAVNGPLISGAAMHSMWQVAGYGATFAQSARDATGTLIAQNVGCAPDLNTLPSDGYTTAQLTTLGACLRGPTADAAYPYFQTSAFTSTSAPFDAKFGANAVAMCSFQSLFVEPTIDGYALPDSPRNLWAGTTAGYPASGSGAKIMLGQTSNDDAPFYGTSAQDLTTDAGLFDYRMNMGFMWGIFADPTNMGKDATLPTITSTTLSMPISTGAAVFGPDGTTPVAATLETYYGSITDPYQRQEQGITDSFFAVNHNVMFDALSSQSGRTPGTLYRFIYAEPTTSVAGVAAMGSAHMYDLTYIWGQQRFMKHIATDNYEIARGAIPFSAEKLAMGDTMKAYWTNFIVTGSPNLIGDGLATWSPTTATEKHNMVFQSTVPGGAILDPCVMFTACMAEPVADYRRAQTTFWTSGFTNSPTVPTCTNPTVGLTHVAPYEYMTGCSITVTPPTAPVTLGGKCATSSVCATGLSCKCVTSTASRRSLLFGMPSSSDCYCL